MAKKRVVSRTCFFYKSPKTQFFALKYLTRYTHERFFEEYINFKIFRNLSHCGVIPVRSFGSHIRPQPHGLGLIYLCGVWYIFKNLFNFYLLFKFWRFAELHILIFSTRIRNVPGVTFNKTFSSWRQIRRRGDSYILAQLLFSTIFSPIHKVKTPSIVLCMHWW
jgi:hypothetical protein